MATEDIIQNMISRLGQSQDERLPPELAGGFAPIDERTPAQLLAATRALAGQVRYHGHGSQPGGDWRAYFPDSAGDPEAATDGLTPPHLALYNTFLRLYRYPQANLNRFTDNHLDFQFRRVLGFQPRPARPDHVHALLTLKKNAEAVAITPAERIAAGKDASGAERQYQPVREVVINHGEVASLRSIHREGGGIRMAPVANSDDGLGATLDPARPQWPAFGSPDLPAAQPGFAVASPLLLLQGGQRRIRLDLTLSGLPATIDEDDLADAFEAYLSGAKGWLGPLPLQGAIAGDTLSLSLSLADSEPAIVAHDAARHGAACNARAPVLQLLMRPGARLRYDDLAGLGLGRVRVDVQVDGLRALTLESDTGNLDPKKAFLPFGAQPMAGSRFLVGCEEALSKPLHALEVKLAWQGLPGVSLATWYKDYNHQERMKNGVSARMTYRDSSGQPKSVLLDIMQRDSTGMSAWSPASPAPLPWRQDIGLHLHALLQGGTLMTRRLAASRRLLHPVYRLAPLPAPEIRSGYITIALIDDFLHADYRNEIITSTIAGAPKALNEPYTPKAQDISLGYRAASDSVDIGAATLDSFAHPDLQFFHVGCFGVMREHAYLRQQLLPDGNQRITLLPVHDQAGEFLIGIRGVTGGDGVSLLLQVAEGSADPDLPAQRLRWSVLCDNYWRPLTPADMTLDSTRELRVSGLLAIALPQAASTQHTIMPAGMVWLRATVPAHCAASSQLLAVAANAVELRRTSPGGGAAAGEVLPPGSITRIGSSQPAIKAVAQPYASFAGTGEESPDMLVRRAAERLRHRNRCITPWDYERLLLEAFPGVHQIKCIPHASADSWTAPGHVLLVAVPDLRNRNATDILRPRVDLDTLARMTELAQAHAGMQVEIRARNPRYQRIRLDFKVRFHAGHPFHYYRGQLHDTLLRALSPWAYDSRRPMQFGGKVYRSTLLGLVEEQPYVDFVTDFRMRLLDDAGAAGDDIAELEADTPDAILVSASSHGITDAADS